MSLPAMSGLLDVCQALSEIPLNYADRRSALQRIVGLGQRALGSRLFTLIQAGGQGAVQIACAGPRALRPEEIFLPFAPGPGPNDLLEFHVLGVGGNEPSAPIDPETARRYGLQAALCCPLAGEPAGWLCHFSADAQPFADEEKQVMRVFARHAEAAMATIDQLQKARGADSVAQLNAIMQEMVHARDVDELARLALQRAMALVGAERGTVSLLDLTRNELLIKVDEGNISLRPALPPGKGITGMALLEDRPVRVDDVREEPWASIYECGWADTLAELALPMSTEADVRIRTSLVKQVKRIGCLNVESHRRAAFTAEHEVLLQTLARFAAVLLDGLEFDRKLEQLADAQEEMVGTQEWDTVIQDMLETITHTLGYDYVNVSLVDEIRRHIKSEYVVGIPQDQIEEFKRKADHQLDSSDIQADIVRTLRIEVPDADDLRFDRQVYEGFGHAGMVRVFIPLVAPSDNRPLGTVEAGHQRSRRRHIYEQDVQVLKGFVDYVARVLERRRRGHLETITHELRAPLVGIRNNASFLQRRLTSEPPHVIEQKFGDILADCEIMLYQVNELAYTLGDASRAPRIERTLVFRDVVIKTLRQLKPLMMERGFDPTRARFSPSDVHRMKPLYVDRRQINQVVYNLLVNAIKYAEDDPGRFGIDISVESRRDAYHLVFKDWGMGIRKEYVENVFKEGFRSPEAVGRLVTGSGLGLSIARRLMRALGGDLELVQIYKPTEFHIVLPRKLAEAPYDFDD